VAAPLRDGNNIIGAITVAKPNRTLLPMIARSERQLLQAAAVLLIISLLIGGLLVWWLNRSIGKLVNYADAVSNGQLTHLPRLHSPELNRLGHSLETMRHQLDGKTYIEQYVHSLTHELKSPLAAIKGAGEILQECPPAEVANRFIANINQEASRMQRLIERMLQLAKLESGQELDLQPCDPRQLGMSAIEARQSIAQKRDVILKTQLTESALQKWDRLLAEQALGNLLDNAIDFAPRGSTVTLSGETTPLGYRFQVNDQGPGIPDYALPRLFERFYSLPRPDKGKSSGLGLSFAMEVARQHSGLLTLANNPNGGVLATLELKK
jgi:two-component system, OmpR family, sensor histidine kinase CreC